MKAAVCAALLFACGALQATTLSVKLDGVEGALKDAALAASGIGAYANREVTAAQAQRLYDQAPARIVAALEPYGYYNAKVDGELAQTAQGFVAELHVQAGAPTLVATLDIVLPAPARDEKSVAKAMAAFDPAQGARLDHAAYEASKAAVQAALIASGYLDAKLTTHEIRVSRADNRAALTLHWDPGVRYRYGATTFTGGPFVDGFLERYLPWREGDFYSQNQLLQLQHQLVDADYFAIVDIQPDLAQAHDGIVPIAVALTPAKRNIYSAGLFIDSDIGLGITGGVTRRWINRHGHKANVEAEIAQRERMLASTYTVPLPGAGNRALNFGAAYRNIDTATVVSNTTRLTANRTDRWHGWLRTVGLNALSGTYTVANIGGNSTLAYPEFSLSRKQLDDDAFVRRGYALSIDASASPGPATRFAALRVDGTWIRGIGEWQRLILRGSLGAMQVGSFDKLPPELRFFAGGDRSIRGYGFQTIGPPLRGSALATALQRCATGHRRTDCNNLIVGGSDLIVGNVEYQRFFTPTLGMAGFVDAGDAFSGFGDFRTHVGAGVGVLWKSPVGMLRAYLGVPVNDPDDRHGVQLHLIIGPDL